MKSSKTAALLVVIVLLVFGGFLVYFSTKTKQIVEDKTLLTGVYEDVLTDWIVWKVPLIANPNPMESIVTGYLDNVLVKGSEFIFEVDNLPDEMGNSLDNHIAALKLKLVEINKGSVVFEVLEMRAADGMFQPPYNPRTMEIANNTCEIAYPLVLDVSYEYCFMIEKEEGRMAIKYNVVSESTMPGRY